MEKYNMHAKIKYKIQNTCIVSLVHASYRNNRKTIFYSIFLIFQICNLYIAIMLLSKYVVNMTV